MLLLFVYLALALLVSFLCSIMEAVLLSTPTSYLMVKEGEGAGWATSFLKIKGHIDKPLAAILSLNTVAHTIGAAGVGAQAVKVFGEEAFGLVSAVLTLLILVITEIIPKTIGARFWRSLAGITFYFIRVSMVLAYPLVLFSSLITKLIAGNRNEMHTSREEISALTEMGVSEGLFNEKENKIIQNLLLLKDVDVDAIMTPRVVVSMADEEQLLKAFLKDKHHLRFSRIPLYQGDKENVTGYVFRQEVLENLAEDKHSLRLKDLKRDIVIVPDSMSLFTVWEKLLAAKEHIALVVDEYGGVDGIVTLEDIIETLLGMEILDETDKVVDMQKFARDRWENRQIKYQMLENRLKKKHKKSGPE